MKNTAVTAVVAPVITPALVVVSLPRTADAVKHLMREIGSRICSIESMKKDGSYARRAGRFGVHHPKHADPVKGNGVPARIVIERQNCLPFFDMNAESGNGDYRKFCTRNLISVKCGNKKYQFV